MKRKLWAVSVITVAVVVGLVAPGSLVLLPGCGGGGGGAAPIALDSTVRQDTPGDQWECSITGTASDGQDTVAVTGTATQTVTANTVITPKGVTARIYLFSMTLSAGGQAAVFTETNYGTQEPNGTMWMHGGEDEGGVYWVTTPAVGCYKVVASPMSQGTSWGAHVVQSNGDVFDENWVVTGTATISVPVGTFETYTVTGSGQYYGCPAMLQDWWAPQIGSTVQQQGTITDNIQGITLNLTLRLKATNVVVPAEVVAPQGDLREWLRGLFPR